MKIHSTKNPQTCGTYAIDPHERIDPWMSPISPSIPLSKDDLPEPTCTEEINKENNKHRNHGNTILPIVEVPVCICKYYKLISHKKCS